MKESKRPKSCSNVETELDRISNLPIDVTEKILSHLPIRDAARTSVLSSKWRYGLAMLPHLVFDQLCNSSIVDHVLLSHIGPISKFQRIQEFKHIGDIDRWILHLSRHSISEFILEIWYGGEGRYTLPSCIFSCQDMIHLKLSGCLLKPPSTFKGFRILKSLDIQYVKLAKDVLEYLIVCCPLLERLTLKSCDGVTKINIDAPNLQFLDVRGVYEDVSMVNMVKFLDINIRFNVVEDILTALCLLRSAPALEKLEISKFDVPPSQCDNVGTVSSCLDDNRSCPFTQLRHVIIEISGLEAELDFIRFLLLSSPELEKMTVYVEPGQLDMDVDECFDLGNKLLRLRLRFSANVEIIYL